jgi:hypothetical protein
MAQYYKFVSIALLLAIASQASGHGTPIQVTPSTSLNVSGGTADSLGYAPMAFFEPSEAGDPFATTTLPTVGPVVIWQIPGYEINGLSETSSLSIEVIARPVNDTLPVQFRSLWYWDSASGEVASTSSPMYLLGTGQRFATIDPASTTPPTFSMANAVGGTQAQGGQQGFHNHGLLSYALDNSPVAPDGAHGFFARLRSNQYAASQPFLIVLNRGVEYERMTEAALAINAAAFLPGDFNHDDRVDAADYVVWRNTAGAIDDYALWQGAFGATVPPLAAASANVASASNVPEPMAGWTFLIGAIGAIGLARFRSALHAQRDVAVT